MTVSDPGFALEALTLPHEDPGEIAGLFSELTAADPSRDPLARHLVLQAVVAQLEIRRLMRIQATVRTEKVRTALLFWHQRQADTVTGHLKHFDVNPREAVVRLLRSGAGCRWALDFLQELQTKLIEDGTWYGGDMLWAIMIQGFSARLDQLYFSETAYMTWMSCLALQPNPKQFEIDRLLDPSRIPKSLRERDIVLWPLDPVECRVRLQSILDQAIPAITEMEQDLKVYFEDPALAEVETIALSTVTKQETLLLRAQRVHEQAYLQATTALTKLRAQEALTPRKPAAREIEPELLVLEPRVRPPDGQPVAVDRRVVLGAMYKARPPPPWPSRTRGEGSIHVDSA